MKTFYFVRHAQYANPRNILPGRLPLELSDEGVNEAHKLSDFFADKKIEKIYSSPVVRCKQTSDFISQGEIPIVYDVRIAETLSAYQGYWDHDWAHFYERTESMGGEFPQDIQDRMVEFWEDIKDQEKGDIIISGHGDPLYLLYAHLTGIPCPSTSEIYKIPDGEYQTKGSIRPIIINRGKISVNPLIEAKDL